jgi:hypothetical protein
VALITDPDRISARSFRWMCGEVGLDVQPRVVELTDETRGTLYRLRHTR